MSAGSNGLAREISALHRGRGLRDPRLSDRVGPTIRAALHVDDAAPDFEVRDRVVAALRSAARTLPGDIQRAFLLASALESDRPTLAERLDEAAAALDRDPRTVRRRLAQADSAVALVLERGARQQPAMEDAWYIESMSSHVDISEDEARTRATKVIVPTQGGLRRISERISLPNAPRDLAPQHHPRIAITAGGHLAQVRHQGSVWSYDIDLDNPLASPCVRCWLPCSSWCPFARVDILTSPLNSAPLPMPSLFGLSTANIRPPWQMNRMPTRWWRFRLPAA